MGGQIVSELTMNSPWARQVNTPLPPVNVYHIGWGINTISWHDRRDHASSRINSREPYPALRTLVECSEGVSRDADELDEWYHSDALFRFAITTHSDRVVRMGRIERRDSQLHPVNGNLRLEGHGQAGRRELSGDVHLVCCSVGESASSKDWARRWQSRFCCLRIKDQY